MIRLRGFVENYLQAIYPFIMIGYVQLQKKVGGTLGEKQTEVYLIKALNWQFSKKKLSELKKFRREIFLVSRSRTNLAQLLNKLVYLRCISQIVL